MTAPPLLGGAFEAGSIIIGFVIGWVLEAVEDQALPLPEPAPPSEESTE